MILYLFQIILEYVDNALIIYPLAHRNVNNLYIYLHYLHMESLTNKSMVCNTFPPFISLHIPVIPAHHSTQPINSHASSYYYHRSFSPLFPFCHPTTHPYPFSCSYLPPPHQHLLSHLSCVLLLY